MGNITQVYEIVNAVSEQALGSEAIAVQDGATLVSLGTKTLQNAMFVENFTNELVGRIGKTIIDNKAYTSKYSGLLYDDFEWGGIVQKIHVDVGDAEEDESVDLKDGDSIDMYKISKPEVSQKFYYRQSAWKFKITIQKVWLRDAFLSASAMGAFLTSIETKVRNKMEIANENLGKLCTNNLSGLIAGTPREIKVLTMYKAATGDTGLSAANALHDEAFLRFFSEIINNYADYFETMNTMFNFNNLPKFTSRSEMVIVTISDIMNALRSQVQYNAYHKDLVDIKYNITVPYWQSPQSRYQVQVKVNKSLDDANPQVANVNIPNLLAIMCDKKAMGTHRRRTEVATTPYNAAGRYMNTFWHEDRFFFNDLDEQAVIFTLS